MTREDILIIGKSVVVAIIVWLSGYVSGFGKGLEVGKDYSFEKVAKEAVKTAGEMLEIAKKLQEKNHLLQEENDRLKEQLNQNEQ